MPNKPRVLIVEDDPASRKLLLDLLRRESCEAVLATGGAEALAILGREPIDLVLLDLMMPEVDGMTVLTELQKRGALPILPVVVVTAHDERKVRIDALAAGAIDFLSKPIDGLEVAYKLRTLLELKRLRDSAVRLVEDALGESDHRLRLRFEMSPVAEIDWNNEFCVTAWNPAAEKLFGYTRDEALGQHASFFVAESAWQHVEGVWRNLMAGAPNESTNENVTKDGRIIVCEWHEAPLTTKDGTILGVSSVVLNVTERVRLQEALVQSRKMDAIGRLAGGVAHDFNNILAVILSYAGFVRDGLQEGDARRADAVEVIKAAERAVGLTKQLLTFSRQQPSARRPTDLNDSLAQLQRLLERTVGEHIALSVVLSARVAVVEIDPCQLDQLVLNLVVNARDAMPHGGRLRIALEHLPEPTPATDQAPRVRMTVADTGMGMDEATQQRIFEPFFTTKERGRGTGIGLATCFGIVEEAGGTLRVRSAPGQGTTFTVELPLCGESVASVQREDELPSKGAGQNVLVVEDEPALRRVVARVLESVGYTVHVACDGTDALEQLDRLGSLLDLVVSDVVMPGCSGYDVVAHAARVAPRARVILTSGYLDDNARRNHPEGLPMLWKPVTPRELVSAVAAALAQPGLLRPPSGAAPTAELVLVVEDDAAASRAMGRLLTGAGYRPLMASTLAEARQLLEEGPEPQIVLSDLALPDGSGVELLRWIQSTRPGLAPRVLVLTGGCVDEADRGWIESHGFLIARKPLDPNILLELLAGLLAPAPGSHLGARA